MIGKTRTSLQPHISLYIVYWPNIFSTVDVVWENSTVENSLGKPPQWNKSVYSSIFCGRTKMVSWEDDSQFNYCLLHVSNPYHFQ
jgi:hypothetical protein